MTTLPTFSYSPRVAILGGGITGLTAAWQLKRAGFTPVVFEKSQRVGGAIASFRSDGWLHELGPNSMLENSESLSRFIDEIGLGARQIYAAPAARNRYIVRHGRLQAMPTSPLGFITTRLFSLAAKLRLLSEPWRGPAAENYDESVADFVLRRLGREFLDYAINPFVGGVYAGDPARLSVRHAFPKLHALEQEHGSLLRGALARKNTTGGPKGRMFSFPNGLGELPQQLARGLGDDLRLRTSVTALRRTEAGWLAVCTNQGLSYVEDFDAVICALPAHALASLEIESGQSQHSLTALGQIEQPPVASVFTGFEGADIGHPLDGFGMLVPQVEHSLILGTLFSSTLFPGRAPEGQVALTTFIGGMREPELACLDDAELLRIVQNELSGLLGLRGKPIFAHIHRCPHAIPQYAVGYQRFKDIIANAEAAAPGLFIGGNCRDGISLSNCIDAGRHLARAAISHFPDAETIAPAESLSWNDAKG